MELIILILVTVVSLFGGTVYWFLYRKPQSVDDPVIIKPPSLSTLNNKAKNVVKKDGVPVKILFYSQTGTAEDFAQRLSEDIGSFGFAPEVVDAENFEKESLDQEKFIIFVASTYGEGDPPDNAAEFHKWLLDDEREKGSLSNLKFAVFGLGNKTYDKFNQTGKEVDRRLEELGAKRMFPLGLGDDDVNIEKDFLSWKKEFGISICKEFSLSAPTNAPAAITRRQRMVTYSPDDPSIQDIDVNCISRWRKNISAGDSSVPSSPHKETGLEAGSPLLSSITNLSLSTSGSIPSLSSSGFPVLKGSDQKKPILADILAVKELHASNSDRSCLHVEVSTHAGLLSYQPGDHIGIYPENDLTHVHKLAAQLNADLNSIISLHIVEDKTNTPIVGPCTLKAALSQFYDITSVVRKPQLRVLAEYAVDEEEKKKLLKLASEDPEQHELYEQFVVHDCRCVSEILKEFKSIKVPLDIFLEVLPKMLPRYYSISSSNNKYPETVHITAVVVDYITPTKRQAKGVATNWLSTHRPDIENGIKPQIPAFIRRSNFKLPSSTLTPILMVGPGTGLAPFRGFIQERQFRREMGDKLGEAIFFFGCRHPDKDFLYKEELENHCKAGDITELQVAFSRYGESKVYVQHKMIQPGVKEHIWSILSTGGHFYVCGDAAGMARDVADTLINIVMEQGQKSREEAQKFIEDLQKENRHQSDVWS